MVVTQHWLAVKQAGWSRVDCGLDFGGRSIGKRCSEQFLSYTHTIIPFLNNIKVSKCQVWNQFLTTLGIGATVTSNVIEIKSCFEHLCIIFFLCTASPILSTQSLAAWHSRSYQRLRTKFFSRSLAKGSDWLNFLTSRVFFLATNMIHVDCILFISLIDK